MVSDILENAHLYSGLAARLARGLDFLRATDFRRVPPGRLELEGQALYVMVSDYVTKPESEGRWAGARR